MEGSAILAKKQVFKSNDLYIDPIGYQVKLGQKEIELTLNEFNLLYLFASNRGKVVKRSELLQAISTPGIVNEDRAINVMICRLRKKIETDPHRPRRIVSVRGLGYRLKE
jgi:DNA-binding response OmpR family regulator